MTNTNMSKKITSLTMVAIIAVLAIATMIVHGISIPQNSYAVTQNKSTNVHDTDCLQVGPGNVNNNKNCNQPEDSGPDNSTDR